PDAPRIASAIGRSNPDPTLRSSAGARLTVMRRRGHSSSAEATPLRTRSFASWQARSARPTMEKLGIADWRCASTSTRRGSSPISAYVTACASTQATVRGPSARVCHETVPDVEQSLPAAGRDVVRCVTSPRNEGSIAFHRRLGFEVEAEIADYDGAGEARVLLTTRLS